MKKMLSALVVVVLMMTMVASVASAATYIQNPFDYVTILCQANAERLLNKYESAPKTGNPTRLYVRHYLRDDLGMVYNNYFKAADNRNGTSLKGGDWMSPDTANYVRSNSIVVNKPWYAYGRANTDYGLTSIVITGYSHANG